MKKTLLTVVTLATVVGFGCKPKATETAPAPMSETTTSVPTTGNNAGTSTMGTGSTTGAPLGTTNSGTDMTPKDNGSGAVKENMNRPNK